MRAPLGTSLARRPLPPALGLSLIVHALLLSLSLGGVARWSEPSALGADQPDQPERPDRLDPTQGLNGTTRAATPARAAVLQVRLPKLLLDGAPPPSATDRPPPSPLVGPQQLVGPLRPAAQPKPAARPKGPTRPLPTPRPSPATSGTTSEPARLALSTPESPSQPPEPMASVPAPAWVPPLAEVRAPAVEADPRSADRQTQTDSERAQRARGASKQGVDDPAGLASVQAVKLMGQGEDQVRVGHIEHLGQAALQPSVLGARTALRAVPVAARVVVPVLVTAVAASQALPAQSRCAAGADAPPRLGLGAAQGVRAQVGRPTAVQHLGQRGHGG